MREQPEAGIPLLGLRCPEQLGPHLRPGTDCVSIWNPGSSEPRHVAAPGSWMGARLADAITGLGCFLKNSFREPHQVHLTQALVVSPYIVPSPGFFRENGKHWCEHVITPSPSGGARLGQ